MPIVLPAVLDNGNITWYAVAESDQVFAQLSEELTSFIGPSYSAFVTESPVDYRKSTQAKALASRFGRRVLSFEANCPEDQLQIKKALTLYRNLLVSRPAITTRTRRPFGQIRSDFDRALLAGNELGAKGFLEELKSTGRVDAGQQKCLEVRLHSGLGQFEVMARNEHLIKSVAELSLPSQTLIDVVSALYETHIRPIESDSDIGSIVEVFKKRLIKPFGGALFRDRKGIRNPSVLKAFLLWELCRDVPNLRKARLIFDDYASKSDGWGLVKDWLAQLGVKPQLPTKLNSTPDYSSLAQQAIVDEDYESLYEYSLKLLPDIKGYKFLLRSVSELASFKKTGEVLKLVDEASSEVSENFEPKDLERIEILKRFDVTETKYDHRNGWVWWAESILKGLPLADAKAALVKEVSHWSIDDYTGDPAKCDRLAQLIVGADDNASRVFRESFPEMVAFFVEQPVKPQRTFTPLYSNLVKMLVFCGTLSADELEISSLLALTLLSSGPTVDEYSECLRDMSEILTANRTVMHLDWALNFAELLALHPAQDSGSLRISFFVDVISLVSSAYHRVSSFQRDILEQLANDYGCSDLIERLPGADSEEGNSAEIKNGSFDGFIGIYTLTEGAGHRAKYLLESSYPNARVEVNSDHEATDRLTNLAKKADVFIFAWKSSKHQAFFCVKNARSSKSLIMPIGKGSASIVRSASQCIETM